MLFVTKCPCDECVPLIRGAGITQIYTSDQDRDKDKGDISYLRFSGLKNISKFIVRFLHILCIRYSKKTATIPALISINVTFFCFRSGRGALQPALCPLLTMPVSSILLPSCLQMCLFVMAFCNSGVFWSRWLCGEAQQAGWAGEPQQQEAVHQHIAQLASC